MRDDSTLRPPRRRVFVVVTDRCNGRCRHCGFECTDRGRRVIEPALVDRFIDAMSARFGLPTHVALTGGEPMLFPEITLEMSERLSERGLIVRLLTNASWAPSPRAAARVVERIAAAGVSGLWVSAGTFHDEWRRPDGVLHLAGAAARRGVQVYLNFSYLHPLGREMRARGLPQIDERIDEDLRTGVEQARVAEWIRDLPSEAGGRISHGWARISDMGRASALIDALGDGLSARVRADLNESIELGVGVPRDLVGIGPEGEVYDHYEREVGRSGDGEFASLLELL